MNAIKQYFIKQSFMKARLGVYENLLALFKEVSSRSTETYAQLFTRWAERDRKRKLDTWKAYQQISKRLQSGMGLADALKPFIPEGEAMILRAGEEAGKMVQVLESIVAQSDLMKQVRTEIMGALMEPTIMILGFLALSLLFGFTMWPLFDRYIPENLWDVWVQPLRIFQIWYAKNWWWSSLICALVIFWMFWSRPRWIGRSRLVADNIPPWSLYRDMQAIQTLIVLGALTQSGLTLDNALERMKKGASRYLLWHLSMMQKRNLSMSANVVYTFSTGLFSDYIVDRVSDASQSKSFNEVLSMVAGSSLKAISQSLVTKAKAINMVAILFVAILFAYSALVQSLGTQSAIEKYEQILRNGK